MTEMPPYPSRGAMEWRNELKTYLDAIRFRGDLPEGTDLDLMYNPKDIGTFRLIGGAEYPGAPTTFDSSVVLEVAHAGSRNAIVQRITVGGTMSPSTVGIWWREAWNSSSGWYDWYQIPVAKAGNESGSMVTSPSVYSIRTTTNASEQAGPNELLIVLEA